MTRKQAQQLIGSHYVIGHSNHWSGSRAYAYRYGYDVGKSWAAASYNKSIDASIEPTRCYATLRELVDALAPESLGAR